MQSILIATPMVVHLPNTVPVFVNDALEVRLHSLIFGFFIFTSYLVVIGDYFEFMVYWGAI